MLNNILSKHVFHTSNWVHGIDWILSLTLRLCWDLLKSHNCNLTPLWWLCLTPVLLPGVSYRWFQLSVSFGNWVLCRSSWWPLCSSLLSGLQPFEFSPLHSDFSLSNSWTPLLFVHAPSTQLYPHLLRRGNLVCFSLIGTYITLPEAQHQDQVLNVCLLPKRMLKSSC